jgi:GNAT superfamily N-acetyltransferase
MQAADEIQVLTRHESALLADNRIEIVRFDPHSTSRADWSAMHAYRRARSREAWPDDPVRSDEQFEEDNRERDPHGEHLQLVARVHGTIVGNASSFLFHPESPNFAERARFLNAHFAVLAPWRGCGIGTRLLAAVQALMLTHDRRILTLSTHEPDGHSFLRDIGAAEKACWFENHLPINGVDWALSAQWESVALAAVPGGRLECFGPRAPLKLHEALWQDVPFDRLERPRRRFEMERVKEWYRQLDRIGGAHELMLLRDGDDRVIGLTEMEWNPRTPDRAFQMLTGVCRDWRGLGLARGLKAAMLRRVRDRYPDVGLVITHNARSNAPMLAVNKKLGCRFYRQKAAYQIDRDAIGAWLSRATCG